jgi:hypothetical protein
LALLLGEGFDEESPVTRFSGRHFYLKNSIRDVQRLIASGTGKTLAAGWLATLLGMPLYQVDLAAVTSKYIGETEKNLAQLLARAEHAEVILLFDEADSAFGKRTEIREANDRFANAQTITSCNASSASTASDF